MEVLEVMKRMGLLAAVVASVVLSGNVNAQSGKVNSAQAPNSAQAKSSQTSSGYLGVFLADVNEARAQELKLSEARGAVVGKVREGSPAEKAGVKADDVILGYNGLRVESKAEFNRMLNDTPPGRIITLGISRAGAIQNIEVTLGERRDNLAFGMPSRIPSDAELMSELAEDLRKQSEESRRQSDEKKAKELLEQSEALRKQAEEAAVNLDKLKVQSFNNTAPPASPRPAQYYVGANVAPLSEQLATFFNVKNRSGLLITEVEAKSPAERAGLKAGDCIATVNGERVNSAADLLRLISRRDGQEAVEASLVIVRDRNEQTIKVKPDLR